MELDPKESAHVWWGGAFKGAAKGLLMGLVAGALAALTLQFVLIPLLPAIGLPSIANAFAGFLTLTPSAVAGFAGGVVPWASFSALPLAIFSGVSGMIGNGLSGGKIAVNAYKQDVEHRMNEARISQIEARERALEQSVRTPSPSPSPALKSIVDGGPRTAASFAKAEDQREQAPTALTIH